jgi:ubiquinone biosynthesis protein
MTTLKQDPAARELRTDEPGRAEPFLTKRHRLREIVSTMARHGFGFLVGQLGLEQVVPFQRGWLGHARRAEPYTRPEHIRLMVEELGATFIKFGQVLSTRPDLLPPDYVAELRKLQDAVPPVPFEAITSAITRELGSAPDAIFREFDPVPVASASIGQVHRATLPDGRDVVVKVQRPGVGAVVERDLEVLSDLARLAADRTALGDCYDLVGLIDEFGLTLREELDYGREGRNADRFRELFRDDPSLYVPTVYWDYSTPRVLTMERIQGIKISDIEALDAAGIDRRDVAERAVAILLQEVFVHGFYHADPHPGNFFVLDGGRIGLMDFGMVGRLGETTKRVLLRIALAVIRRDPDRLVDALIEAGLAGGFASRAALKRDLAHFMNRYLDRPIREIAARQFVNEVLATVRRHRLQMPADFAQLAKVIGMSEGLGAQLDPEFKLFEFAAPYFQELWREGRSPLVLGRTLAIDLLDLVDLAAGLPRRAGRFLTLLERDGLQTTTRIHGLEPALAELSRIANRLSLSILTGALVVGLGLLMQFYHPPFWSRIAAPFFFSSTLAAFALGAGLFWSMLRGWAGGRRSRS